MDKLVHFRPEADSSPVSVSDCLARYMCTKHSWRGKYRRVFCILPGAIVTQHPDTLAVTNTYAFLEESDLDGIIVGGDLGDEQEFTLNARQEKKVRVLPPRPHSVGCADHHRATGLVPGSKTHWRLLSLRENSSP